DFGYRLLFGKRRYIIQGYVFKILNFSILKLQNKPISMSNITNNYLKVLEVINSLNIDSCSLGRSGRKPKMSDTEVVALSLTAEFMSIDSENDLFRQVSSVQIPHLIERSQFNKRRRKLFGFSETIRLAMASKFTELEIGRAHV